MTLLLLVSGIVLAGVNMYSANQNLRNDLISKVRSLSEFISADQIQELKASDADLVNPAYLDLKRRMIELGLNNRDIRFAYLLGKDEDGAYFFVDSEEPNGEGYSPPGERYDDASAELIRSFSGGQTFIEGPTTDSYGTWLSGLSPILSARGEVVALFGMDINYNNYIQKMVISGLIPLITVASMIAIMLVGYRMRLRQQRSFDLKAELVSVASHDIRSPLSGIEWAAKSIASGAATGAQASSLAQAIGSTATELHATVNTLLQLAVDEQGLDKGLRIKEVALLSLLREVKDAFMLTAQAKNVVITIDSSVNETIKFSADPERLKRAIANIVNNAVKYTRDDTSVVIRYRYQQMEHVVAVSDQGIGIPEADREAVLTGFHRAANAARSGIEGTGLGMVLARRIIEAHQGSLRFDTELNVGTTFYITLPSGVKKTK